MSFRIVNYVITLWYTSGERREHEFQSRSLFQLCHSKFWKFSNSFLSKFSHVTRLSGKYFSSTRSLELDLLETFDCATFLYVLCVPFPLHGGSGPFGCSLQVNWKLRFLSQVWNQGLIKMKNTIGYFYEYPRVNSFLWLIPFLGCIVSRMENIGEGVMGEILLTSVIRIASQ